MKVKLLILIEPAPYVLDFIKVLGAESRKDIMILFARNEKSQPWSQADHNLSFISYLPKKRFLAMFHLWRLLRRDKIELLHTAGWNGVPILFAWFIARIKNIPLFVEFDTSQKISQSGFKNQIKNRIYPLLYAVPTCLLPAGKKGRDYLLNYGVDNSRIVVHQMSIDVVSTMKYIDQLRAGANTTNIHNGCRFLFVGRLIKRKGLSTLLKAFAAVTVKNSHCQLVIAGEGECKSDVLAAAQHADNIAYCGHLDGAALLEQYALADVFVFPAFDEPWGLVINEAMAASLPVIVGEDVGCTDDLVKQGVNGFLIPTDDYIELSDKMLKLADDSALRKEMGQASRKIITNWTMEEQVRIIEGAWDNYSTSYVDSTS